MNGRLLLIMIIDGIDYENYKIIKADFDGTVWMSDDPPCDWWLVIRCDAEHDRKTKITKRDKYSKKIYHSIIKELWA